MNWFALALGLAAAHAPDSVSESARVELTWQAPPGCPGRDDVLARVQLAAEQDADFETSVAQVSIVQTSDGFIAQLTVTTATGQTKRDLEASSCEEIADASALIIAMLAPETTATDDPPERVVPAPSPEDPVLVAPAEPIAVLPPTVAHKPDTPSSTVPSRVGSRAAGALAGEVLLGIRGLPAVGLGLGGAVGLLFPRVRFEFLGRFWFSRQSTRGNEAGVDVRMWTLGLRGGPVVKLGPLELLLRVGGHVGQARGVGVQVPISRTARRTWLSLGAHPAILWPVSRYFAFGASAEVEAVVLRPSFAFSDAGTVFEASTVTGTFSAVAEVRFP